jgi:hypothetical protein
MEEVLSLKTHVIEIFQMGVLIRVVHQTILSSILKTLKKVKEKFTKS